MTELKDRGRSGQEVSAPQSVEQPLLRTIELTALVQKESTADDTTIEHNHGRASFLRRWRMLGTIVVLPTILAALYFFLIAADVYVSESRFVVRSASRADGNGLAALVQTGSLSRAMEETYAVKEYMRSYDAMNLLLRNNNLRKIIDRPEADSLSRFPNIFTRDTQEQMLRYYRSVVDVQIESSSGICTLTVQAFRPGDAQALADALLTYGERFINNLNARAHEDAIAFSQGLVDDATRKVTASEAELAAYRNKEMLLDPQKEAVSALSNLTKLASDLSRMRANLAQQEALSPHSPALESTRAQINSFQKEYDQQKRQVAGGNASIASKLETYEQLALQRELAVRALTSATGDLEKSKHEAELQRLYLQRIVSANSPDEPVLPRRLLWVFGIFILAMLVYWIVRTFANTALEHQA